MFEGQTICRNEDKNQRLKADRSVSFEQVQECIVNDRVLDIIQPTNPRYAHQKQLVIRLNNYIHIVPYVEDENGIFLKTIIPQRKKNKLYD